LPDRESKKEAGLFVNLAIGIIDWGESVDDFHRAKDAGSLEMNQKIYFKVNRFRQKEAVILTYCPALKFPDFSHWNEIIKNNKSN
jgi:hypothetical protein